MCNAQLKQYSIYIIVLFIFSLLHYFFHEFYLSDSTFLLSKCKHRLLFDVLKRIIQINVFHDIFVTVDMIMIIFNILKKKSKIWKILHRLLVFISSKEQSRISPCVPSSTLHLDLCSNFLISQIAWTSPLFLQECLLYLKLISHSHSQCTPDVYRKLIAWRLYHCFYVCFREFDINGSLQSNAWFFPF